MASNRDKLIAALAAVGVKTKTFTNPVTGYSYVEIRSDQIGTGGPEGTIFNFVFPSVGAQKVELTFLEGGEQRIRRQYEALGAEFVYED